MYLACADKEIDRVQKVLYDSNKKLIDSYYDLPFYKRIFAHKPDAEITIRWSVFHQWMMKRIMEKSKQDNVCQN